MLVCANANSAVCSEQMNENNKEESLPIFDSAGMHFSKIMLSD